MISIKDFTPREYQQNILETAKGSNTLVCLPTGTGKTKIAILLAIERLNQNPTSKILICSPTKPLTNQIAEEFKSSTTINPALVNLLTGAVSPEERKKFWQVSQIIAATPQTIQKDLESSRISLEDVSLLCIDECHRSRMRFANTRITKVYLDQSKFPRILALTASPGATKEKIQEICQNLHIESVEIKTEEDEDVKPYIQEKETTWINVDLPPEFKEIHSLMKDVYKSKVESVRKFGLHKPANIINKRDLLDLQKRLQIEIRRKNMAAFWGSSLVAQALKLSHAIELLETQSLSSFHDFLEKLKSDTTKASKIITKDKNVIKAQELAKSMIEKSIVHPKFTKLKEILESQFKENPSSKTLIFTNFRDTTQNLLEYIKEMPNAKPAKLIGQKEGLSQKKQIETIKKFEQGVYNILIATSIGEEGLSIGSLDVVVFFDSVASEIRSIQRSGRVARIKPGKIIFLMTKASRDQAYYFAAKRKEKTMRKTLTSMQKNKTLLQSNLQNY